MPQHGLRVSLAQPLTSVAVTQAPVQRPDPGHLQILRPHFRFAQDTKPKPTSILLTPRDGLQQLSGHGGSRRFDAEHQPMGWASPCPNPTPLSAGRFPASTLLLRTRPPCRQDSQQGTSRALRASAGISRAFRSNSVTSCFDAAIPAPNHACLPIAVSSSALVSPRVLLLKNIFTAMIAIMTENPLRTLARTVVVPVPRRAQQTRPARP